MNYVGIMVYKTIEKKWYWFVYEWKETEGLGELSFKTANYCGSSLYKYKASEEMCEALGRLPT